MRRRIGLEGPAPDEDGFTLIELVIVVVVLPIVIGGIAAALLVFGLQNSVQNRIGNSNDQLVSTSTFNKDVQSAQQIETVTSPPACGAAVTGQTQLVGLQWGQDSTGAYQTVVSYVVVPTQATVAPYKATNSLVRNLCTSGASTTPTSTRVISHDVAAPVTSCPNSPNPACTVTFNPTGFIAPNTAWASTQGLYGVFLNIVAPGSSYTYTLSGLPSAGPSTGAASQIQLAPNPAGCNLASPNSGSYSSVLCFADFTGFTNTNSNDAYCANGTGQHMTLSIADSPDILQFCVTYTGGTSCPTQFRPTTTQARTATTARPTSATTVSTRDPGQSPLYQMANGAYSVVTFTNIEVTNAVGEPATGWELVTGDAESTDTGEWISFTSNLTWSILPNTSSSLYGNSCYDGHDTGDSGLFNWTGPTPPTTTTVGNAANGPPQQRTPPRSPPPPARTTHRRLHHPL